VALIAGAAALALALWLLPSQRPYGGRPVVELVVTPELDDPPKGGEMDGADLLRGFEALALLGGEVPGTGAQEARYSAALAERFPAPAGRVLSPEVSLAGWRVVPAESGGGGGGGRLMLLLRITASPSLNLGVFVHSLGDERTLPQFPEYWRGLGKFSYGAGLSRPTGGLAPGSFVLATAELPRFEGELAVRIGLMGEGGAVVGEPADLGMVWHGATPGSATKAATYPARIQVRRAGKVTVDQPVRLEAGSARLALGRGSADTSDWDRIDLSLEDRGGPGVLVRVVISDEFSRAARTGRLAEGSVLSVERQGSEFQRPVKRWRVGVMALGVGLAGLVVLAFRPRGAGRAARYALLTLGLLVALRVFMAESVTDRTAWWVVLASDVLIAGVVAWLLVKGAQAFGLVGVARDPAPLDLRSRWRSFAAFFAVFSVPLVLWYIGEWPGHPYYDECAMYDAALRFETQPWLCTFYSVYAVSVLRLFHEYTAVCLVNIAILSWALADFFSLLLALGVSRAVVLVFAGLIATSIPLGLLMVNMTHDILAACLKITLVVVVLKIVVRSVLTGSPGATASLRSAGALVLLTVMLRNENMALLAYVPVALLLLGQARPVAAVVLAACLGAGTLLYRAELRPRLDGPKVVAGDLYNRYTLLLLIGPMGYLIQQHYDTPTPEEDRAAIGAAIEYDQFVKRYTPFDIGYAWGITPEVTKERLKGVRGVLVRGVLNNPGLFARYRLMVLRRCIDGHPDNWYPFKAGRERVAPTDLYPAPFQDFPRSRGMVFEREHPGAIARLTHFLRDWAKPAGYTSPGSYLWNAVPALVLMLAGLVGFRRLPVTAALCGLIAAPLALLAVAAPVAQFKYIADLYILGFLVVPLIVLELGALARLRRAGAPGADGARCE
jgi:hypothetical protein